MPHTTDIKGALSERAGRQKGGTDIPSPTSPRDTGPQRDGAIRLLRADEIECRVSTINAYGLRLLLYKDARVDQKILDEMFTPFGWQRTHQEIAGNLYCTVSVWDDARQRWISKQDVGTASYSDKEKGQASDSFKRACFNWGIGRELYTAPDIWVPASRTHIREDKKRKDHYITTDRFSVQSISYNGYREICALTVVDQDGREVFRMRGQKGPHTDDEDIQSRPAGEMGYTGMASDPDDMSLQMGLLYRELERTGIRMETILERYGIQDVSQMTPDIYARALNGLRKTKTRGAA